jgi:hypothetical protein
VGVMRAPAQKTFASTGGCRPYMAFMRADCKCRFSWARRYKSLPSLYDTYLFC